MSTETKAVDGAGAVLGTQENETQACILNGDAQHCGVDDNQPDSESESEDYSLSDNDIGLLQHVAHHDQGRYLAETLTATLESVELDKSLALEAQISGRLNSKNQELVSKKLLLAERLENLQQLYKKYFKPPSDTSSSVVDQIRNELKVLEQRVHELKYGKSTMFRHKLGVVDKFPIEYNQAKEKVLERVMD